MRKSGQWTVVSGQYLVQKNFQISVWSHSYGMRSILRLRILPSDASLRDAKNCPLPTAHYSLSTHHSNGFTLLEVILAMAIFATAMAMLGEGMRQAVQCANYARDVTRAQFLCESKMSEIIAGITPTDSVNDSALDTDDNTHNWTYSVSTDQPDNLGTLAVTVSVTCDAAPNPQVPLATLTRWMVDPTMVPTSVTDSSDTSSTDPLSGSSTGGGGL